MNDFLKSLNAFGMEGLGIEVEVDQYAGSECAEELIELDNMDASAVALESMTDAIMEGALESQHIALEAAGFTLETASGYTGELSTESITNMAKRGYYDVKILAKKAIAKIWKLIMSVVDSIVLSDGRLKSYGKLFKKYNERLSKVRPFEKKDGEEPEVTIRVWGDKVLGQVNLFKLMATGGTETSLFKTLTNKLKSTKMEDVVSGVVTFVASLSSTAASGVKKLSGDTNIAGNSFVKEAEEMLQAIKGKITPESAAALEKKFNEWKNNIKETALDDVKDFIKELKVTETEDVTLTAAKEALLATGRKLETACSKDVKFKKDLIQFKKAWDKKTGEWDLKSIEEEDTKAITASILRILNGAGVLITAYRVFVSRYYKSAVSNMQGVLADMAKVIAKGTRVAA